MLGALENWTEKNVDFNRFNRYFPPQNLTPYFKDWEANYVVSKIGKSVDDRPIFSVEVGSGEKKILLWSQMHGNESTTTRALIVLLDFLRSDHAFAKTIVARTKLCIIPMLNPDGAEKYTRVNANEIDLNRDAQDLSQPESRVLRNTFDDFSPDFCFNLHGQRTIFGVGDSEQAAALSFLTPAEDSERLITAQRKRSMELIVKMNRLLQAKIPGMVGRYDDSFNLNCVGDTFQSAGIPTMLFEAGHYPNDYNRNTTCQLTFYAMVCALHHIATSMVKGDDADAYFDIPENQKTFSDFVVRNAVVQEDGLLTTKDLHFHFKEVVANGKIAYIPEFAEPHIASPKFHHEEFHFHELTFVNPSFQTFSGELPLADYLDNINELANWMRKIQ